MWRRSSASGRRADKQSGCATSPDRLTPEVSSRIATLVATHPDLTVAELRERLAHDLGVKMSWSMVRLWLGQLGLRLKKSRSTPSSGTRKQTASVAKSSSSASGQSRRRG